MTTDTTAGFEHWIGSTVAIEFEETTYFGDEEFHTSELESAVPFSNMVVYGKIVAVDESNITVASVVSNPHETSRFISSVPHACVVSINELMGDPTVNG